MTEETRIRNISRQIQHLTPEGLPAAQGTTASLETVMAQRGDTYTQHLLNRITQSLNAMLRHRTAPVGDVVLRAEQGEISLFEQVFLAHFEGGAVLGENLPPGVLKFLPKPSKEWMAFFQKFLPFTLQKTAKMADLQAVIFRGLLQEMTEPALLISDLQFLNGKTDKFTRLKIQGTDILKNLETTMPGDALSRALVAELVQTPEFNYLSLSHRVVNTEKVQEGGDDPGASDIARAYQSPEQRKISLLREGVRMVSQGIALSARTEQLMAEKLDLKLGSRHRKKEKYVEDLLKDSRKFSGKPRWFVPFTYFVIASGVGLLVYSFLKFLWN